MEPADQEELLIVIKNLEDLQEEVQLLAIRVQELELALEDLEGPH